MIMPLGGPAMLSWAQQCAQLAPNSANRNNQTVALGRSWAMGLMGWTLGNLLLAPNPPYPNCSIDTLSSNTIENPGIFGLSSLHPGGANVLMADGSVRFLKNTTNNAVIWALGSRSGGEVVSADSF
jgi:prepilin-type processing-associated H-X9-DG protein